MQPGGQQQFHAALLLYMKVVLRILNVLNVRVPFSNNFKGLYGTERMPFLGWTLGWRWLKCVEVCWIFASSPHVSFNPNQYLVYKPSWHLFPSPTLTTCPCMRWGGVYLVSSLSFCSILVRWLKWSKNYIWLLNAMGSMTPDRPVQERRIMYLCARNGREKHLNRIVALLHVFISCPRTVALQLIHVKGHFTFSCIACLEALWNRWIPQASLHQGKCSW